MLLGIVGGKLQGVEATYLARKAGWEVRVVDRESDVPAANLGDAFAQVDVSVEERLDEALGAVDFVVPALEDHLALSSLTRWSRSAGVPLAFDPDAYAVSSSKAKSARLFEKIGLSTPNPWPDCGFPVLAKPDEGSGSKGVRVFRDLDSLRNGFPSELPPRGWILEELLDGSEHSLEVIGCPGHHRVLQVTDLYVDREFDCKRVVAPSVLPPAAIAEFGKISLLLAEALDLHGIMDVEAVYSRGEFKVLEIDARLPSQTPTAVYWSTQQNMIEWLGRLCAAQEVDLPPVGPGGRGVVYEHICVSGDQLETRGERIIAEAGPLALRTDFFGADEALTNFEPGRDAWVATLIYGGVDRREACEKRNRSIAGIVSRFGLGDAPPAID